MENEAKVMPRSILLFLLSLLVIVMMITVLESFITKEAATLVYRAQAPASYMPDQWMAYLKNNPLKSMPILFRWSISLDNNFQFCLFVWLLSFCDLRPDGEFAVADAAHSCFGLISWVTLHHKFWR